MTAPEMPIAEGPEKAILSNMLRAKEWVAKAKADGLTPEHFGHPARATLFTQILANPEIAHDPTSFVEELHRKGILDEIGGAAGFMEIMTYEPGGHYWANHARILRETLARRRAIADSMAMLELATTADANELAAALTKASNRASDALQSASALVTAKQGVDALVAQMRDFYAKPGKTPGIETGMGPIDLVTGGLGKGQLWVVAGPTSGGKSVWMLQAAVAALAAGYKGFIASLEMQSWEVFARLATCHGRIPFDVWTKPREFPKARLEKAKQVLQEVSGWQAIVDDRGNRNISEIVGTAQTVATMMGGLDFVAIDYLQLVSGMPGRKNDNREREIAGISAALKGLAKELQCPVITASQLNDDGRLRESRAIGHDADVVLLIEEDGIRGVKVRNGKKNQLFPLILNGEIQRFVDR